MLRGFIHSGPLYDEGDTGGSSRSANSHEETLRRELEKRDNDAHKLASDLLRENFMARTKRRDAEDELERLKSRVPAEGAVILSKEEAEALAAYRALGKADEIKAILEQFPTVQKEAQSLKREKTVGQIANKVGYKASVLQHLDSAAGGLDYLTETEEVEGESVQRIYVKAGDTKKLLETYAQENWADFLPALQSVTHSDAAGSSSTTTVSGRPMIPMSTGKAAKSDFLDDFFARTYGDPTSSSQGE